MWLARREFLRLAAGAATLAAAPRRAGAQNYPTRPLHIVSPASAGGATDILGRLMGDWLSQRLGQAVIVDNRPGGGTNIGTEAVVHAPADGRSAPRSPPPRFLISSPTPKPIPARSTW